MTGIKYPRYFITPKGNKCYQHKLDKSADGTPRYICNPNSPGNTYSLKECLKDWKPIY